MRRLCRGRAEVSTFSPSRGAIRHSVEPASIPDQRTRRDPGCPPRGLPRAARRQRRSRASAAEEVVRQLRRQDRRAVRPATGRCARLRPRPSCSGSCQPQETPTGVAPATRASRTSQPCRPRTSRPPGRGTAPGARGSCHLGERGVGAGHLGDAQDLVTPQPPQHDVVRAGRDHDHGAHVGELLEHLRHQGNGLSQWRARTSCAPSRRSTSAPCASSTPRARIPA